MCCVGATATQCTAQKLRECAGVEAWKLSEYKVLRITDLWCTLRLPGGMDSQVSAFYIQVLLGSECALPSLVLFIRNLIRVLAFG